MPPLLQPSWSMYAIPPYISLCFETGLTSSTDEFPTMMNLSTRLSNPELLRPTLHPIWELHTRHLTELFLTDNILLSAWLQMLEISNNFTCSTSEILHQQLHPHTIIPSAPHTHFSRIREQKKQRALPRITPQFTLQPYSVNHHDATGPDTITNQLRPVPV